MRSLSLIVVLFCLFTSAEVGAKRSRRKYSNRQSNSGKVTEKDRFYQRQRQNYKRDLNRKALDSATRRAKRGNGPYLISTPNTSGTKTRSFKNSFPKDSPRTQTQGATPSQSYTGCGPESGACSR